MKFIYIILAVALFYVGSIVLLMNLSSVSNLQTVELNGEVHVVPSNIFHSQGFRNQMSAELSRAKTAITDSEILQAKRQAALGGIKSYADFHYSMMGNMIQQLLVVASFTVKAGEKLGADFNDNPKVKAFLTQTQRRLTQQVFSPLTQMNPQEQTKLYQHLDQSRTSLMSLVHNQLQKESLFKVSSTYLPKYKHDFEINKHGLKLGVSAVVGGALMFRVIRKRIVKSIEAVSVKIMGKIIAKFAAKQGVKTGGRFATIGAGALTAGAACAWGGPLALLCGTGGAVIGFLTTEYVFNELDELITRDDFESNLNDHVNTIFNELVAELSSDLDQLEKIMLSHNKPRQGKVYLKDYL
jgi:hypothetical protein